ncbi:NAD(P)H-dependent oxidoreductase [Gilvimarinus sp. SDUM040013]|uniref:FMN dependent NADH:quinone oxidoreductase n=1 Tax=Gilvimarinus gilvus TaxID=3058038 RepID=A0ABU4S0J9_9GAMM|nr:NAD(P)H-dependent oxidoreductase [Gilvimarinus sp. SDUM040013]MDO3385753.1 NAD(P)H-dependent oxidoreductase [Gilvimarinus sp. SDUM040013]MDX6849393.1 NAD(P)H-dependent oxidoreductase [Gilvimarinus sp. SDUM040013]
MKTLLQIKSSLNGDNGQSSFLSNQFANKWLAENPDGRIIERDLSTTPVPHLDGERFNAFLTSPDKRTPREQAIVDFSDELINEIKSATVVSIGLPMYNFGIPSTLKAYFDHIARSGITFRYTSEGPVGLIEDKPVHILAARGGHYAGTQADSQTGYMNAFLGFIGLHDVNFIYAEGLATGGDERELALNKAQDQITKAVAA